MVRYKSLQVRDFSELRLKHIERVVPPSADDMYWCIHFSDNSVALVDLTLTKCFYFSQCVGEKKEGGNDA